MKANKLIQGSFSPFISLLAETKCINDTSTVLKRITGYRYHSKANSIYNILRRWRRWWYSGRNNDASR